MEQWSGRSSAAYFADSAADVIILVRSRGLLPRGVFSAFRARHLTLM